MPGTQTETTLPASAQRVQDHLHRHGFACTVLLLPHSTRTAAEAAAAMACQVAQIAKSLVFRNLDTDQPVLIIASGAHRVDVTNIERQTGLHLGKAEGAYVKERVGFAIGGIPPVAHATPLQTILDTTLQNYDQLWAAAGTPHALFRLTPDQLALMTGGTWLEVAEQVGS